MKPVPETIAMRRVGPARRALGLFTPGCFDIRERNGGWWILFVDPYGVWHDLPVTIGTKVDRAWLWDGNVETPTVQPSVRHVDPEGWHGFITAGEMLSCADSGNQPAVHR